MKLRDPVILPPEIRDAVRRANRVQWASLAFMMLTVFLVYFTMGNSVAMKAVWVEDVLSLIPPAAYLISSRVRWKPPTQRFPYGYHHVVAVAFLSSAVTIVCLGGLMLIEAARTLIGREHPSIGVVEIM